MTPDTHLVHLCSAVTAGKSSHLIVELPQKFIYPLTLNIPYYPLNNRQWRLEDLPAELTKITNGKNTADTLYNKF